MDEKDIEHRLTVVETQSKRNEGRIKDLEKGHEVLNRLVTAVEVMATKQNTMGESVDRLEAKVDILEAKPAKYWDGLVDKLLFTAAGAFIAWVLSGASGL